MSSADQRVGYRVRYFSSEPWAPRLWWWEASACAQEENLRVTGLAPLPTPDGAFTHASDWLDAGDALCSGPREDLGYVLAPGCSDEATRPEIRIVLERVEVAAP